MCDNLHQNSISLFMIVKTLQRLVELGLPGAAHRGRPWFPQQWEMLYTKVCLFYHAFKSEKFCKRKYNNTAWNIVRASSDALGPPATKQIKTKIIMSSNSPQEYHPTKSKETGEFLFLKPAFHITFYPFLTWWWKQAPCSWNWWGLWRTR